MTWGNWKYKFSRIKSLRKQKTEVKFPLWSVTLSLFASDSFEIWHLGGLDGRSNDLKVADLGGFFPSLVVFEEYCEIHHILQFDKLEWYQLPIKVLGSQTGHKKKQPVTNQSVRLRLPEERILRTLSNFKYAPMLYILKKYKVTKSKTWKLHLFLINHIWICSECYAIVKLIFFSSLS